MQTLSLSQIISCVHVDQQIAGTCFGLVAISFGLRMYVRICIKKQFGIHDWAMVAAFVFAVAYFAMFLANSAVAIDVLAGNVDLSDVHDRLSRSMGAAFMLALMALKISVGFFFLGIFTHQRFHRLYIYFIMISSTILGLSYTPLGYFTCAQLKVFAGDKSCPVGIQRTSFVLFVLFSLVNIIGDFGLCLLGCAALWHIPQSRLTKLMAGLLLCIGCLGGVASIVRLSLYIAPTTQDKWSQELSWLLRWMVIEVGCSVLAANLVLVKPLFQTTRTEDGPIGTPDSNTRILRSPYAPWDDLVLEKAPSNISTRDARLADKTKTGTLLVLTDEDVTGFTRDQRRLVT